MAHLSRVHADDSPSPEFRPAGRRRRRPGGRRWVVGVGLVLALAGTGACGGDDPTGPVEGLRPGTYSVKFELAPTVGTPVELRGRHDFTFRVRAPAASADDFELVSSRRTPQDGGTPPEEDYLRVDPALVLLDGDRWQVRLPYAEGDFAVSVTLRGSRSGGVYAPAGCYGRAGANASYLGAGCVIERL